MGSAQLLVHTGLLLGAPHTLVLGVCVLTETAVLPPQGAVVQSDYDRKKLISRVLWILRMIYTGVNALNESCFPKMPL